VLILDLVINDLAIAKLEARGITTFEVEQVIARGPAVGDNPTPRVFGSKMVVGPTDGARLLTLILQPDEDDPARWHVMTGWESSARQIDAFHTSR
jgi:hypothetical protein